MRRDGARQKWITLRRGILAEVVASDPKRTWSVRELTAEMLRHPTIQENQPDLAKSTVHRDWLAMKGSIHTKITELADIYTTNQLEVLADLTEELTTQIKDLKDISFDDIDDPAAEIALRLKVSNQIKALGDSLLKVQKRESAIVPNNAPKVLQLEETKTYTLDMFLELRKQVGSGENGNNPLLSANTMSDALLSTDSLLEQAVFDTNNSVIIPHEDTIDGEIVE